MRVGAKRPWRMGDAYKCTNCGTVVETPQSCPECGQKSMRPIQSSPDASEPAATDDESTSADESVATTTDDGESSTDESAATTTDDGESAKRAADDESETTSTATEPGDTVSTERRTRADREAESGSGLLSWLKSLF